MVQSSRPNVVTNSTRSTTEDVQTSPESPNQQYKDRGWAWVVLLGCFMITVIIDAVCYASGLFLVEFLDYFDETKSKTSLVGSVLTAIYLMIGPVTSVLIAKFGCRSITILGSSVAACGFFVSAFSPNVDILIITFGGLGGLGFGLFYLGSVVMIGEYFEKHRALATGFSFSGSGIGVLAFSPLWELLISNYGWKGTVWIISGIVLNVVPIGALFRPLPADQSSEEPEEIETNYSPADSGDTNTRNEVQLDQRKQKYSSIRNNIRRLIRSIGHIGPISVLKSPSFCLFIFSLLIFHIGYFVPVTYLPNHAIDLGIDETQAALLMSLLGIFNTLSRAVSGWVTDKHWVNPLLLCVACRCLAGVVTCSLPFLTAYWMLAIYASVYGACLGVTQVMHPIIMVDLLGVKRLKDTFGVVTFVGGVSCLLGPPIAGMLYDNTQSYIPPFVYAAAGFVLGGLLCLPVNKIDIIYKNKMTRSRVNHYDHQNL